MATETPRYMQTHTSKMGEACTKGGDRDRLEHIEAENAKLEAEFRKEEEKKQKQAEERRLQTITDKVTIQRVKIIDR
jgi:hypothetical protein